MDDFVHKKSLGQNFLTNPKVSEWMADTAELVAGETVLEIGPGTGMLTRELLKRGAHVVAIEADARAIAILEESFKDEIAGGNLVLHHADIREFDLSTLGLTPHEYKLIANIPYYLSGMLFRMFLESACQPKSLVFLTQKEVAERIAPKQLSLRATGRTAGGGFRRQKESLLSLSVKAYGTPTYIRTISRGNFKPSPKVDSAIIRITDISKNTFKDIDEEFFFEILHLGFAAKRKQLLGNLSKRFDRDHLIDTFSTLDIPENVRGEDLSINVWLKLVIALKVHT